MYLLPLVPASPPPAVKSRRERDHRIKVHATSWMQTIRSPLVVELRALSSLWLATTPATAFAFLTSSDGGQEDDKKSRGQ